MMTEDDWKAVATGMNASVVPSLQEGFKATATALTQLQVQQAVLSEILLTDLMVRWNSDPDTRVAAISLLNQPSGDPARDAIRIRARDFVAAVQRDIGVAPKLTPVK